MITRVAIVAAAILLAGCAAPRPMDDQSKGESAKLYKVQQQLNGPAAQYEMRRAVANPKIGKAQIEDHIKNQFGDSAIDRIKIERSTLKWAKDNLDHHSKQLTDDSDTWTITVEGDLEPPFPHHVVEDGKKKRIRAEKVVMVISAEDGDLLAARAFPKK